MKRAKSPADIPEGKHYQVIVFNIESVYIEGDERSRSAPGHGYPAHTDTFETNEIWVTEDVDDWTKKVSELSTDPQSKHWYNKPKSFVALVVEKKAKIKTEVIVSINN